MTFPFFIWTLQINLLRRMRVTGLITQGAKRIGSPEYVKSYKVAYSDDGKTWRTYKVKGKEEDMVRHTDMFTVAHCLHITQTRAETGPHALSETRYCTHSRTRWRTWWDGFLISWRAPGSSCCPLPLSTFMIFRLNSLWFYCLGMNSLQKDTYHSWQQTTTVMFGWATKYSNI